MPADEHIWKAFSRYLFLTVKQAAELLERDEEAIQKRFNKFFDVRYLNRERQSDFHPYVYFLAREGGKTCFEKGYLIQEKFIADKSPERLPHEMMISEFHLKLEKALKAEGRALEWHQWHHEMEDMKVKGKADKIPDGRFAVDGDDEYTPFENQRTRHGKKGTRLIDKLPYYESLGIKRVCILLPTAERRKNFLEEIEAEYKTTRFWFSTYELALSDPLGKIWLTPKNFRDRQYSILKPEV